MTTIKKFKWFWAWDDEKEETWLSNMAREGWHLKKLGFPGNYTFESGKPREDHYRMDFITNRKNFQIYLQLFNDAGWEHLGELGGWQYFRTSAGENNIPEIYTDKDSKAKKYQRLIAYLIIFFPMLFIFTTRPVDTTNDLASIYMVGKLLMGILLAIYAYAMVRILGRIQQLKNK